MDRFSLIAVATAASLFASGCTQTEAASRQTPRTEIGQSPAGDPIALISTIDTTTTLGAWTKAHPVDSVVSISVTGYNRELCRTSIANVKIGAVTMMRSAVFEMLEPPIGEKLPADSVEAFNAFCTLRTIWMSSQLLDSADARIFADSVGGVIAVRLGSGKPQASLFTYEADDAVGSTWKNGATTIVLAVQPGMKVRSDSSRASDSAKAKRSSRVLLVGYGPGSSVEDLDLWAVRDKKQLDYEARFAYRVADSAIGWANVPAIAADLRFIIGQLREEQVMDDLKRDPAPFRPRADGARSQAIQHYRDALAGMPNGPARRLAWINAVKLILGLSDDPEHICFYD